jgi:hypothetical protein
MMIRSVRAIAVAGVFAAAGAASASWSWNPIAFGPLGSLPNNAYWTSVIDASADGRSFVGLTSQGQVLLRTPDGDYRLTGTGSPFKMTPDGQTVVGGVFGGIPQRWDIANAAGGQIASQNITWTGGPLALGAAYGVNSDATHFAVPTPNSTLIRPTGHQTATNAFQQIHPHATAGAFRGLATDAPILVTLGTFPGVPTNAHRWNYSDGTVQHLTMPAGYTNSSPGNGGHSISGDGMILGGSVTVGGSVKPYWWDASGTPHAVPLLTTAISGNMGAMNYTGTLGGGLMGYMGATGNRAMLHVMGDGPTYNLHDLYTAEGLLPTGWRLINVQHISNDGSRIFCLATAPDGSSRVVLLEGDFVPAPTAMGVLAMAGLMATRRRRSR